MDSSIWREETVNRNRTPRMMSSPLDGLTGDWRPYLLSASLSLSLSLQRERERERAARTPILLEFRGFTATVDGLNIVKEILTCPSHRHSEGRV